MLTSLLVHHCPYGRFVNGNVRRDVGEDIFKQTKKQLDRHVWETTDLHIWDPLVKRFVINEITLELIARRRR